MEVTATVQIFERSVEKHGLVYENFVGDGDSKTFKAVCDAKPYGEDILVKKKECVGHVHKRMGSRLRNLVKTQKNLQGPGKLTGKQIDKLSRYYGNAIRDNKDDPQKMKKAIWATYNHRASTDEDPQHFDCSPTWCDYLKATAAGNLKDYKHPEPFPPEVLAAIHPIDLLEKCVGGLTQNNNESFNSTVWKMAPKAKYSGAVVVEIATCTAAAIFNNGYSAVMAIMADLGISVGPNCQAECQKRDEERVNSANRKTCLATKTARIAIRQARLARMEHDQDEEGCLYAPGIAD